MKCPFVPLQKTVRIYFSKLLFLAGDFMLEVLFLYSGFKTKNVSRGLR